MVVGSSSRRPGGEQRTAGMVWEGSGVQVI